MMLGPEAIAELRLAATQALLETERGWTVMAPHSRYPGHSVWDGNENQLLECYGGKERYHVARHIACAEPAVVLALLDRIAELENRVDVLAQRQDRALSPIVGFAGDAPIYQGFKPLSHEEDR
jgi:hypothetical protein